MKYRFFSLVVAFVLVVSFLVGGAGSASAVNAPWLKLLSAPSGICTWAGGTLLFPFVSDIDQVGSNEATLAVPGYGTPGYYKEDHTFTIYSNSYGLPTSAYTVPANTLLTVTITIWNEYGQSGGVSSVSWLVFDCTTGAVVDSYFGGGAYEAAPIPAGFKQYNITCDSAVYDTPGGTAVGSNVVKAGQAWNINTTPVAGPNGQNWTEIFVAGVHTGYIPTACVGGPTPFN